MQKFNIIAKADDVSKALGRKLEKKLLSLSFTKDINDPELVIILGGDGKFLRTIHHYMAKLDKIHFVILHTGTLGFSSDYSINEFDQLINDIINGQYEEEKVHLLDAEFVYENKKETHCAINEIRLENRYRTCVLDVYLNDNFFENFRGNGLCVSTPFGSTGYNKSLNGAVVLNDLEVLQLTEIAGIHNNSYNSLGNSLIVSKNTLITIKPDAKYTLVGLDHLTFNEENLKSVNIKLSDKYARLIHYNDTDSITRIRKSFINNLK